MEIGSKITSSFGTGYGTAGLFLQGTFFGHACVAILTNSHVIGAERNARANGAWVALNAVWTGLTPRLAPGPRKRALANALWGMLPEFLGGTLPQNPSRQRLDPTAPDQSIFGNGGWFLTELFGSISTESDGVVADVIYQPEIGSDFAVAPLRTGIAYDNMARRAGAKHAIPKLADPQTNHDVYKFGATTQFTVGVVDQRAGNEFLVKGPQSDFSDKGDSGSAVFDNDNAWIGLIYADAIGGVSGRISGGSKCIAQSHILSSLWSQHKDDIALAPGSGKAP